MVGIGLTDMTNIGGASGPPGPPGSGITLRYLYESYFKMSSLDNISFHSLFIFALDLGFYLNLAQHTVSKYGSHCSNQCPYSKVRRCALFMKQNLRFGLGCAGWTV